MSDKDDPYGPVIDQLLGAQMTLSVFMLQVGLELARKQDNPGQWAKTFIAELYARLDSNEATIHQPGDYDPFHEHARKLVDALGRDLMAEVQQDRD